MTRRIDYIHFYHTAAAWLRLNFSFSFYYLNKLLGNPMRSCATLERFRIVPLSAVQVGVELFKYVNYVVKIEDSNARHAIPRGWPHPTRQIINLPTFILQLKLE